MDSIDDADRKKPEGTAERNSRALDRAVAAGERTLRSWIADGRLLTAAEFALRRSVPAESLLEAEKRGELVVLSIDKQRWYPAVILEVSSHDAGQICCELGDIGPISKMFFFMHEHGGIGGLTVSAALPSVGIARVLQLAEAWRIN